MIISTHPHNVYSGSRLRLALTQRVRRCEEYLRGAGEWKTISEYIT